MDGVRADTTAIGDDPGWRPAVKAAAWALIPGMAVLRARRPPSSGGGDALTPLRSIFLTFALTLCLIGIVVGFLAAGGTRSNMSARAGPLLVAAVGTVTVLVVRFVPRPLDCRSDASLAASYRSRFFLRLAFAQAAALCGFVAFFLTADPAMYPLGLVFSAAGFASLAPTAAHLHADQQQLDMAGCGRSLVRALRFGGTEPT
jgi:hypothetical protein